MQNNQQNATAQTVLQVDGITCLDCAGKFETAVRQLPDVISASLNPMTGRLTLTGVVDLPAIRALAREEGYTIFPLDQRTVIALPSAGRQLPRALLSGLFLTFAYGLEKFQGPAPVYLALYIAAMVLGGWGNFRKASYSLRRLNFNMSVLMSVAVTGAVGIGQYEEGATVAFLYAVSELLEGWTMEKSRRSIRQLMDLAPKLARVRRNGIEFDLPVEEIAVGEIMIIRPGVKIALDGNVLHGESAINQAAITGESLPVEKSPGAPVFAGTLNTYGALEVEVTRLVRDTTIARIIHMVEAAQTKRAPSQAFVEKFAAVYTPVVMMLAAGIVFLPPLLSGLEWQPWIYRGLALLVVACPCALVVSTPAAIVSAIGTAARNGVLIKGGIYLEEMGSIQAIALDKTGTLTEGRPVVTDILPLHSLPAKDLLALAADVEARSEHPLTNAIVDAAREQGHMVVPATDFQSLPGRGAQASRNGEKILIGNPRLFEERGIPLVPAVRSIAELQNQGKTVMIIGTSTYLLGLIAVADALRKNSPASVAELKRSGIRHTILLTGDNAVTAAAVAAEVGVDEYRAELLPQDKLAAIHELRGKYGKVAMVGDGINDAPALALSTVGIAMGGAGADTALETADVALMADDLDKLTFLIRLSRQTLTVIRQNIAFSLAVKALAILAVFPGWLTLWLAILADMGATLLVTLNSLRLLTIKDKP
ncbi:MAG: cadmium-translocating P-type ATPase [Veillonellaceae bacterium]|nr:cadmium-translocating P-type ATPase [Veillonellaceae bacterium]